MGRFDSGLEAGDPNDPLLQRYQADYAFGLPYIRSEMDNLIGPNNRIKSRTVWNFSLGQEVKLAGKKSIEIGANLLNAFDEKRLYNFLSTFGGTHVIPPRTLAINVKFKF